MTVDQELDRMQMAYKHAVGRWIDAIRREESLGSVNHSLAEVDKWEAAGFAEEALRGEAKAAKTAYESALRETFFRF